MRRKRANRTAVIPDLSNLRIKPHWWLEMHKPIQVEAYKMPYGIQARAEHQGVRYSGTLHPGEE